MRKRFSIIGTAICTLVFAAGIVGQNTNSPERTYEITLNVLSSGTGAVGRAEIPQPLAAVVRQLRTSYGLDNLRLAETYIGRLGSGGNLDYKSLASFGAEASDTPSFLDWSFLGVRETANANSVFVQGFHFGLRVPVRTSQGSDQSGKSNWIVNYEAIGINSGRFTAALNTPVLL